MMLAAMAIYTVVCRADGRVVISMSASDGTAPAKTRPIRFTTSVLGSSELQEIDISQPIPLHLLFLVKCDEQKVYEIDPNLKAYTLTPVAESAPDFVGMPSLEAIFELFGKTGGVNTGKVVSYMSVKDMGMSVAPGTGRHGHHYLVDIHRVSSGAAGTLDIKTLTDFWMDPNQKRPDCPARGLDKRIVTTPSGAKIEYDFVGDVDAFNAMSAYLPLLVQIHPPEGQITFQQVESSTTAPDASLFTVRSDFKLMTAAEFAKAEVDAVIDVFAGPASPLPKSNPKSGN